MLAEMRLNNAVWLAPPEHGTFLVEYFDEVRLEHVLLRIDLEAGALVGVERRW
jgi:hypothetical protein